eukprot:scaffold1806_cov240-Pinguiococcus_pyrenoidosus.AAC.30
MDELLGIDEFLEGSKPSEELASPGSSNDCDEDPKCPSPALLLARSAGTLFGCLRRTETMPLSSAAGVDP